MGCPECKRLQEEEAQAATEFAEAQQAFAAYILMTDEMTPRFTELHNAVDAAQKKLFSIHSERLGHESMAHPQHG